MRCACMRELCVLCFRVFVMLWVFWSSFGQGLDESSCHFVKHRDSSFAHKPRLGGASQHFVQARETFVRDFKSRHSDHQKVPYYRRLSPVMGPLFCFWSSFWSSTLRLLPFCLNQI